MPEIKLESIDLLNEAPLKLQIQSLNASSIHWHNEYEVLFVLQGSLSVTCKQNHFSLKPGDLLMIGSQEVHATEYIENDNLCLVLQFSPTVISEVYHSSFDFLLNTTSGETPLTKEVVKEFQKTLAGMCLSLYYKPDGYQFEIKSGLYHFISLLFLHVQYHILSQTDSQQDSGYLEDLDRIKTYIKGHFKEELHADLLARTLGMSRAKLYQILQLAGSGSIKKLTNYYRISHAKHLLKNSDTTIPYIASESGFDSESSFFRVFKAYTGMSPNEFRNAPSPKMETTGVQGYKRYASSEAIHLLEQFFNETHPCQRNI